MDVFDSSLLDDSPSTSPDDVEAFAKILDATLDPMLEMSRRMIELKKDATEWNKAVFLINCEVYLQVRRFGGCFSIVPANDVYRVSSNRIVLHIPGSKFLMVSSMNKFRFS
jgi:UDP:flavonoid glycosyltransferase YjiC (YdhE family)